MTSFLYFNRYGYPRGSHEIHLKEIVEPVLEIYAIELLGSMSTDEAWRPYIRYIFIRRTLTYREYVYKSFKDSLNIAIAMGSQKLTHFWRKKYRNMGIGLVHVKRRTRHKWR